MAYKSGTSCICYPIFYFRAGTPFVLLHALFSERKFLRIGLSFVVFILPNTAALSGLL